MRIVYQHVTDGPVFRVGTGESAHIRDVEVRQYGSTYGRVLFAKRSPVIVVESGAHDVLIEGCSFKGA